MKEYTFFNTDLTGFEEYDISGEDYAELIRTCCRFSKYLSLRICKNSFDNVNELERFRCKATEADFQYKYVPYYGLDAEECIRYYRICPELEELLINAVEGIMSWVSTWGFKNPEDPVFYRAGGSVFFHSVIHDGYCNLYPREDEDVDNIISNPLWLPTENGKVIGFER